jgi:hypothetical protein
MARFKTQARAVDMLGRQQIAGVPTAIAELFKNAHDAYADRVEADYFYQDDLLVVRDDGMGMTAEDLESRWLTLGTDSKVGSEPPSPDPKKDARPTLGEKGIGRLAIALLGRQVLLLTRPAYGESKKKISAAFVNWSLFECPGLTLEDVEIPVRVLDSVAPPSRDIVDEMIDDVRKNVESLRKKIGARRAKRILGELDSFVVNPAQVLSGLGQPSLFGKHGRGTCLVIQPAIDQIERDIELDRKEGAEVSDLRRQLLGFCNTMIPGAPSPTIRTALRYWPTNERPEGDLVEDREFFTPEEFEQADHRIRGRFDENGNWRGTVAIYGEASEDHEVTWSEGAGRKSACGPFEIDFAYIQGKAAESRLPADEYLRMDRKLDRYGGLYVYRDGVRVSPYGSPEQDFLKFEERRSKGFSHYFFSHRRMFGAISISTDSNRALTDKAGREGLQQNRAYRDFQNILIGFFVQLAGDYFRRRGEEPGIWQRLRDAMQQREEARKAREEKTETERQALTEALESFFDDSSDSRVKQTVDGIVGDLEKITDRQEVEDPKTHARDIQRGERDAQIALSEVRKSLEIHVPKDLGLTREQRRDVVAYEARVSELEDTVFRPVEQRVTAMSAQALSQLQDAISTEERVESLVSDVLSQARERIDAEAQATRRSLGRIESSVGALLDNIKATVNDAATLVEKEIRVHIEEQLSPEQLAEVRYDLVRELLSSTQTASDTLRNLRAQLDDIGDADGEAGISSLDITAALEEALIGLEEQADINFELVQLGMAIETIDHEFRSSVNGIRRSLRRLRRWGKANPQLDQLVIEIEGNFTHLDEYLKLFTPLQRRLYRRRIPIPGEEIGTYLERLFKDRLKSNEIALKPTRAFEKSVAVAFPSMLYPVYINLVDNAIFWLSDAAQPREIILDIDGKDVTVSDSGPGVAERDKGAIFERGFTRKPGGRGLGLFIAREAVRREGLDLVVDPSNKNRGACFRLVGILKEEGAGE